MSKLTVRINSDAFSGDIFELKTTGFNHFNEVIHSIKGSIKHVDFTAECIFGCPHTYSGYVLSIISNQANTSLSVKKSLFPQCQIWSPTCHVGIVEVALPQGSIQVFIQTE